MTKSNFRVYWVTCVLTIAIAATASATTIVMPTDEQLVQKSPVIVRGVVLSSIPVDRDGAIWTETMLQIDEHLKGETPAMITIREVGGILGDHITKIFGSPEYVKGQHVLAFLAPTPRGDYQTIDLFAGKFTEGGTAGGQRLWLRDTSQANVSLLDANFQTIASNNMQRDAAGFEQYVADRVSGSEGAPNYGIENPVLAPAAGRLQIEPNFTLISEPSLYRWFAFDNGSSVPWYSSGTQPGYTGGGVTELQTAMAVWSGYTSANIRYTYNGTFSGTLGGLGRANGTNEILFNDPLNEIAGSWNPSTGGVVGTGGFNGVSSQQRWTATFSADSTHLAQAYSVWNITEGNLVIQDNVSSSTGITSKVLGEIIAHELGHTLGFGHSADNTALMFATVTGLGPSLRADDQLAARWLYPSGSSTAPPPAQLPPAAPTSLSGSVTSTSTVALNWVDNSTNESGFHVYYAAGTGGGAFTNIGDMSSNVQNAVINGLAAGTTSRFYVTAFNSTGESAASNVVSVTLGSITPLVAAFSYSPTNVLTGSAVSFSDQSTGGVTSWLWNFGDGGTSSIQNPVKTYANPGPYTVTLTVRRGAESAAATKTINVGSASPAMPLPGQFQSLVPVTAQTTGAGGSIWRTELTVFNAGSETAALTLSFVPGAGVAPQTRTISVLPRETRTWANALLDIFGMSSGAGGINIAATSATTTPDLRVSSRTFAATQYGTYGQSVPDVESSALQSTLYMTGIISSADFRTNIGLVNRSTNAAGATLTLIDANGAIVENVSLSVPANSFQQASLAAYFPSVSGRDLPLLSLRVGTGTRDALSVYASVVDNRTQDPVYIQAMPLTSTRLTIPVVARANGANGTVWRSDVTMFNPNNAASTLTLTYRSPSATRTRMVALSANNAMTLADVVSAMGEPSGSGVLDVAWSGANMPVVTSRTYTVVANGGTFGQSVDPVAAFSQEQYVTGLRSDGGFRTNVGFVNGGDAPISVQAIVLSASGARIGSATINLAARAQVQVPLASLVPGVAQSAIGSCTLDATSSGGSTLFVYGSVVDNSSGDPVFFAGK